MMFDRMKGNLKKYNEHPVFIITIIISASLFFSVTIIEAPYINAMAPTVEYDMIPIPFNHTDISLRNVTLDVIIDYQAHVAVHYTLQNTENNHSDLILLIPFFNFPHQLRVFVNNTQLPFYDDIVDKCDHKLKFANNNTESIKQLLVYGVNLSFDPLETKTLVMSYSRPYHSKWESSERIDNYWFHFITSTAKYWNHPIESLQCIFHINIDYFDHDVEITSPGFEVTKDSTCYLRASQVFTNITGTDNEEDLHFTWEEQHPHSNWFFDMIRKNTVEFLCFFVMMIPVVFIILALQHVTIKDLRHEKNGSKDEEKAVDNKN